MTNEDGSPLRLDVALSGASFDLPGLAGRRRPGAAPPARHGDPGERPDPALDDGAAVRGEPRDPTGPVRAARPGRSSRAGGTWDRAEVIHLNEGHPALAPLELAAARVAAGTPFEEALAEVRERVVAPRTHPFLRGTRRRDARSSSVHSVTFRAGWESTRERSVPLPRRSGRFHRAARHDRPGAACQRPAQRRQPPSR